MAGVSLVVLNVTVTVAAKASYLIVGLAEVTRPTASSINVVARTDRANLVTVPLGTIGTDAGKISIFNNEGGAQVIADVIGSYMATDASTAGGFDQSVMPERKLNIHAKGFDGPLAQGEAVSVPVSYLDNTNPANIIDANPHIRALAVNITAVSPTKPGCLTAWDGDSVLPGKSTLNLASGTITPNMAIVPVGPVMGCGTATGLPSITVVSQSAGTVHVLVDIVGHVLVDNVGYYDDGQQVDGTGAPGRPAFQATDPDPDRGHPHEHWGDKVTGAATKSVTAPAPVAGADTWSLVTNTTAVLPTLGTYLTVWPDLAVFGFPTPADQQPQCGQGPDCRERDHHRLGHEQHVQRCTPTTSASTTIGVPLTFW